MRMRVDKKTLRIKMVEMGLYSLEELGRRSGVTTQTMRRMFAGGEFESTSVSGIATVLGCSPLDLLTVEEPANGKGAA